MNKKTTDNQEELFVVVDKNDKVLGYKTRRECHQDKNLIHRAIHILIENEKGEVLLQKRSLSKDLQPGFYTLSVGGHVARGESYNSSAKRELYEELGIKIPIKRITKYLAKVFDQSEYVAIYRGIANGLFKIDKSEVEAVKFFTKKELKKLTKQITPISILSLRQLNLL